TRVEKSVPFLTSRMISDLKLGIEFASSSYLVSKPKTPWISTNLLSFASPIDTPMAPCLMARRPSAPPIPTFTSSGFGSAD
ncbi:MAG: hypothetical protein ABF382_14420, partial [Akkermansiaceae bacterium]